MSRKKDFTLVIFSVSFFQKIILCVTFSDYFLRAVREENEGNQDWSLFDPVPDIYDWASADSSNDASLQAEEENSFSSLSTKDYGLIESNNDLPFQSVEGDYWSLPPDNELLPLLSEFTATSMYVRMYTPII